MNHEQTTRLGAWIADTLAAGDLALDGVEPMSGGSIQENWRVRCRVGGETRTFVLRKDAFDRMIKSQPRIEDKILATVSERMRYR